MEKSGIEYVSFPLAAGIGVAALWGPSWAVASASCALSALLLVSCCLSSRRCAAIIPILFFCLGFLLWNSAALCPGTGEGISALQALASAALDNFKRGIDAVPFTGEHTAPLLKALLCGDRSGLERGTVSAFRQSGASHILALSGLHLGVIYALFSRALKPLGNTRAARTVRSSVIIAASGFYVLMTGAAASTIRALLFIIVKELSAALSGRRRGSLSALCIALTVHLILDPRAIAEAGFQLSYLAMMGILVLYPRLEAWFPQSGVYALDRFGPVRRIWNSLALSISCQMFTAPLVWLRFGTFPQYFLLTNLISLPLAELLIVSGVGTLALHCCGADAIWAVKLCDFAAHMLESCLSVIAEL